MPLALVVSVSRVRAVPRCPWHRCVGPLRRVRLRPTATRRQSGLFGGALRNGHGVTVAAAAVVENRVRRLDHGERTAFAPSHGNLRGGFGQLGYHRLVAAECSEQNRRVRNDWYRLLPMASVAVCRPGSPSAAPGPAILRRRLTGEHVHERAQTESQLELIQRAGTGEPPRRGVARGPPSLRHPRRGWPRRRLVQAAQLFIGRCGAAER